MPFDMGSTFAIPFSAAYHRARAKRVLDEGFPGGLLRRGGEVVGLWAAFPGTFIGHVDVVSGWKDLSGRPMGLRFTSAARGGMLTADVERRVAACAAREQRGAGFVDAVVASLAMLRAARDARRFHATALDPHGALPTSTTLHYPGNEADLMAGRLGRPSHELDLLGAVVLGRIARGPSTSANFDSDDERRTGVAADLLARRATDVAEPFVSAVRGPAFQAVEAEIAAGRAHVTLRWLDDEGWSALDDPGDPTGLRAALAEGNRHADLMVGGRCSPRARVDVLAAAGSGHVIRHVPARVASAFLASAAGGDLHGTHAKPFSTVRWGQGDPRWAPATSPTRGGIPPLLPATAALAFLGAMPPDWCPVDEAGWSAFARYAPFLMSAASRHGRGMRLQDFLRVGGRWEEYARRLDALLGDREDPSTATRDVSDVETAFAEQVVRPGAALARTALDAVLPGRGMVARIESRVVAARCLWGGRSLVRILELSARWHRDQDAMIVAIERLDPSLSHSATWDPGLPSATVGEVDIVCLASPRDLREEGAPGRNGDGSIGLSHCVGSYVARCRSGESRILSLRSRGVAPAARLSTAEVALASLKVVQHSGWSNSPPTEGCKAALAAYMAMLADGRLAATRVRRLRNRWVPGPVEDAGYDFRVPGRFEAVRDLWRPYLAEPTRDWTPDRYRSAYREACGQT